ncbi:MAG: hypothetical protein ABI720_06655 [Actinomycetes bacterium]
MSIDTLARQASQRLLSATCDLDLDDALRQTTDRTRRRRGLGPTLVIVTAIIVLIMGWSLSGELRRSADPAPPVDAPHRTLVGEKLGAPMTAMAPPGWDVVSNRGYVEMRPADGSPGIRMLMLVPRRVYDPASQKLEPLKEDPVIWMTTHPEVTPSGRFGVDGPDFAWAGTKVDLSLSPKANGDGLHLLPLSRAAGSPPLAITANDAMFRWTVIYFENSDPLAITAISPTPDDPVVQQGVDDLLASIVINNK